MNLQLEKIIIAYFHGGNHANLPVDRIKNELTAIRDFFEEGEIKGQNLPE